MSFSLEPALRSLAGDAGTDGALLIVELVTEALGDQMAAEWLRSRDVSRGNDLPRAQVLVESMPATAGHPDWKPLSKLCVLLRVPDSRMAEEAVAGLGIPPVGARWSVTTYRPMSPVATTENTPVGTHAVQIAMEPDPPLTGGRDRHAVLIESDCEAGRVDSFNRWYDEVHIPDVLASPGYRAAWRLELEGHVPGRSRYLTVYEVHADDVGTVYAHRVRRRLAEAKVGAYAGATGLISYGAAGYRLVSRP